MNEPIRKRHPNPPGLLPKNVQSWLLIGFAVLMVVIMWLTGGKKPSQRKSETAGCNRSAARRSERDQDRRNYRTASRSCSGTNSSPKTRSLSNPVLGSPAPDRQQAQRVAR